jgi:hypothetical protein
VAPTVQLPQELGPDRLDFGGADLHAQHFAQAAGFTPMAMMAATETMRPRWLTVR